MSKNLTIRKTDGFEASLAVLTGAKLADGSTMNATEAVHWAVEQVANGILSLWDYGDYPDGVLPPVTVTLRDRKVSEFVAAALDRRGR